MSVEKGSAFLLKIGDGGSPLAYTTIAGLRTTQLSVSGEAVNITNKDFLAAGGSYSPARACAR